MDNDFGKPRKNNDENCQSNMFCHLASFLVLTKNNPEQGILNLVTVVLVLYLPLIYLLTDRDVVVKVACTFKRNAELSVKRPLTTGTK